MISDTSFSFTNLFDWKGFELFVAQLYKDSEDVIVEHNVTEIGKSGAKRQIDVLILQKLNLHTLKILIECKFWQSKVDRHVIDILSSSIEDINASKGVIFTTKGYEDGAIKYAKNKNIDIFIIREVYDNEWGSPGRNIIFYQQVFSGKIQSINLEGIKTATRPGYPFKKDSLSFEINFTKNMELKECYTLYSLPDFKRGPNLEKILADIRNAILKRWVEYVNFKIQPEDGLAEIAYNSDVKINFKDYKFNFLKVDDAYVGFDFFNFTFLQSLQQTKKKFDRAESFDFILMVENYITNQKNFISKSKNDTLIKLSEPLQKTIPVNEEVFINGSIIKLLTDYYVHTELQPSTIINKTPIININLKLASEVIEKDDSFIN